MAFSIVSPTEPGGLPLPGICKSCGSATKEKYLDTGTQENDYGAIMYCFECINHIASLFDFLHPDKVKELRRMAETQYMLAITLRDRNEQLTGVIDDLVRSGYRNDSIDFVELDMVHLDEIAHPDPPKPTESMESRTSDVIEQSDVEGSDSIPTNGKEFVLFE